MNWKIALVLSALTASIGALVGGCENDACTRADDQLAACVSPEQTLPSSGTNTTLDCTPKRACQADCINTASCVEISQAQCYDQIACRPLEGPPSAFTKCMSACDSM